MHKDKQHIIYNVGGDGFLDYLTYSKGYTYALYFHHHIFSEKIINTYKCSPIHARVIGLIAQLQNKNYTLGMDNLYMPSKLFRVTLSVPQIFQAHVVTRYGNLLITDIIN